MNEIEIIMNENIVTAVERLCKKEEKLYADV